jgi:predicted lipoprotein with Yx(FWY)xxD motif
MRFTRVLTVALLAVVATAALSASAFAAPSRGAAVQIGSSKLGGILVNNKGRTLYVWAHDKSSKSTCSGECANDWPPLITAGKPRAAAGVRAGLLGTTRRGDGRMQVTYHGHPLYTFELDKRAGDTKGQGRTDFGGRWSAVSASGHAVSADDHSAPGYQTPVKLKVITPGPGDVAGAGGAFNIDLSLQAQNAAGNEVLSAANGYQPFFNDVTAPTFGPGKPDPGAPGLVVTLSTTPAAAGGPNANLAGVFQLNAVNRHNRLIETFNDWEVGSPGFFGVNQSTTMAAYLVQGTAPGVIQPDGPKPISNVVTETFTIGG